MGLHSPHKAQIFSVVEASASLGRPTKRMQKLVDTARVPAKVREYMASGRKLNILRQLDLIVACVSSGV